MGWLVVPLVLLTKMHQSQLIRPFRLIPRLRRPGVPSIEPPALDPSVKYSHGTPMVTPWYPHGTPMVPPWYPHGTPGGG